MKDAPMCQCCLQSAERRADILRTLVRDVYPMVMEQHEQRGCRCAKSHVAPEVDRDQLALPL